MRTVSEGLPSLCRHIGHNFYYGTRIGLPEACMPCAVRAIKYRTVASCCCAACPPG